MFPNHHQKPSGRRAPAKPPTLNRQPKLAQSPGSLQDRLNQFSSPNRPPSHPIPQPPIQRPRR